MARLGDRLRELFLRVLDHPLEQAHQAALRLLKENLSPGQRHQLEQLNFFDVVGGDTGSHYWSTPNEVVRLEVWLCHRGGLQWRRSTSLKRSLRSCGRLMF
jgi:hypothetical protein